MLLFGTNLAQSLAIQRMKQHTWHRGDALKVAKELCALLQPHCERLIVAGSLRRRRLIVGDVELLYIPKTSKQKDGFFDEIDLDHAEQAIQSLLTAGIIDKRPNVNGHFTWGRQNKLAIHKASGIPVDLFATDEKRWWVSKVIRTGGKDTNLMLTTGAQKLGRKLHAYGAGFTDTDGSELVCCSEEDVFKHAGVPYQEPHMRT